MDDEIRVIVIATRFDEKPKHFTAPNPAEKPSNVGLYTEAAEKKELHEPKQAPEPVQDEDPFDTIFKIFNSK